MPTYVKLKRNDVITWREKVGDQLFNPAGGYDYAYKDDEFLETVVANYFSDLDWSDTHLTKNTDSDQGWLSPDAKWYPCHYKHHSNYAYYILHKNEWELEKEGWARIRGKNVPVCFDNEKQILTIEQRRWLIERDYEFFDKMHLYQPDGTYDKEKLGVWERPKTGD